MRIIAGRLRGRRIVAPTGWATRPTTDRVREAWFSILGPLHGVVADIYAGTGALGFEALSRGADRVVFVENARPAQDAITRNAASLGVAEGVDLIRAPLERARSAVQRLGPYELVLTDPPWTDMDAAERALQRLLDEPLVVPGGRVVIGHPKGRPVELEGRGGLRLVDRRAWGDSAASFFVRDEPASQAPPRTNEIRV